MPAITPEVASQLIAKYSKPLKVLERILQIIPRTNTIDQLFPGNTLLALNAIAQGKSSIYPKENVSGVGYKIGGLKDWVETPEGNRIATEKDISPINCLKIIMQKPDWEDKESSWFVKMIERLQTNEKLQSIITEVHLFKKGLQSTLLYQMESQQMDIPADMKLDIPENAKALKDILIEAKFVVLSIDTALKEHHHHEPRPEPEKIIPCPEYTPFPFFSSTSSPKSSNYFEYDPSSLPTLQLDELSDYDEEIKEHTTESNDLYNCNGIFSPRRPSLTPIIEVEDEDLDHEDNQDQDWDNVPH